MLSKQVPHHPLPVEETDLGVLFVFFEGFRIKFGMLFVVVGFIRFALLLPVQSNHQKRLHATYKLI